MTSLATEFPGNNNPDENGSNRRKGRRSTREKIEKLVAEGAKNYPAYLKLIYTGDSELSSEEENVVDAKNDLATVTVGFTLSDGHASVNPVVSPESVKLLDPGKEKPTTPIGIEESVQGEKEKQEWETVTESLNQDEMVCITDDAKEVDETERVESQQSMEEKWKIELFQLQDDIVSLRAMLNGKLEVASDLKQRLGIGPMTELKQSIQSLKQSGTFAKTNAALRSFGAYASRKMGSIRNSVVFKSVEEKVGKVKSRSMGHLKLKLHRKLPASKSDSHVGEMETTGSHLAVIIDSTDDLNRSVSTEASAE